MSVVFDIFNDGKHSEEWLTFRTASINRWLSLNVFEKSVILKEIAICSQVRSIFLKIVLRMDLLEPVMEVDLNPYLFIGREIFAWLYLAFIFVKFPGFLLEAGTRVPAPVHFEQGTRLLKVRNEKKKQNYQPQLNINYSL